MSQYTAWQEWIAMNTPVVILVVGLLAGAVAKLLHTVWNDRKSVEDSNIDRLIISIEKLVKRIDDLFIKHDNHDTRIGKLEKRIEVHFTRCNEREKVIEDIKERQDFSIKKFDKAIIDRKGDAKREDRCDREN